MVGPGSLPKSTFNHLSILSSLTVAPKQSTILQCQSKNAPAVLNRSVIYIGVAKSTVVAMGV
jgi:hypothetical protein